MAEPFKNLISPAGITRLAEAVVAVEPSFDAAAFAREAAGGLEPLELKARVAHVGHALRRHLPADWATAASVLVRSLPPAIAADDASGHFSLWPVLYVVEAYGADDPAVSLPALHAMTQRWSAEFAIRPLLVRHPGPTWATLEGWAGDPSVHVRRLASEGTRPRLPWGMRLQDAVNDPSRGLALLDRLVDDPSEYVRRSVANHLGDVAKDHPDLAVDVAARWRSEGGAGREALVRHGLRSLLKQGHPRALALLGQAAEGLAVEALRVTPATASVGGTVEVRARLVADSPAVARVDVVWQWPGARASWSTRVFRGGLRELAAGAGWEFVYRLALRPVTTRPLRPGPQRVFLRVNGRDHGPVAFVLGAGPA